MAVSTLDALLAGFKPTRSFAKVLTGTMVAGRPVSLWGLAGIPGAGAFDNTLNGVVLSSSSAMVNGQIPHVDPVSGNAYLGRLQGQATIAGTLLLCDRLWHNGGFTITVNTLQTIASPTWPARDAAASTDGDGVLLGVEVSSNVGAGTPTITVAYVNSTNTGGARSATNLDATVASPIAGTFHRIGLQAGDTGVRSVSGLTLSATWTSGVINLVAYRVLASLELTGALVPSAIDAITAALPRLPNGVVPFLLFIPSTTTTSAISGTYAESQG